MKEKEQPLESSLAVAAPPVDGNAEATHAVAVEVASGLLRDSPPAFIPQLDGDWDQMSQVPAESVNLQLAEDQMLQQQMQAQQMQARWATGQQKQQLPQRTPQRHRAPARRPPPKPPGRHSSSSAIFIGGHRRRRAAHAAELRHRGCAAARLSLDGDGRQGVRAVGDAAVGPAG